MSTVPPKGDPMDAVAAAIKERVDFRFSPDVSKGGETVKRWCVSLGRDQTISSTQMARLNAAGFAYSNGELSIVRSYA